MHPPQPAAVTHPTGPQRRPQTRRGLRLGAALLVLAALSPAQAHDTWLVWRDGAPAGRVQLLLGTGEQYPRMSSPVPASLLRQAACSTLPPASAGGGGAATQRPLRAQDETREALLLHGAWPGGDGGQRPALSCWAETQAQEIVLRPAEVAAYLDEVQASPAVRQHWARLAAQGLPWRENFSKHARLELLTGAPEAAPGPSAAAAPTTGTTSSTGQTSTTRPTAGLPPTPSVPLARVRSPLPVELVIEPTPTAGATPTTAGVASASPQRSALLTVRLWRDGSPAPDHPVQLLGDELPRGLWLRTDDQGRLRLPALPGGSWLLRGADLQAPAQDQGAWRSRFFSLRVQVGG